MRDVRAKYIADFQRLSRRLASEGKQVSSEIRIELDRSTKQELYRLYVLDFIERNPDGTIGTIELACDPIETAYPDLQINVPVCWNAITFMCRADAFAESDALAWGNRWIHDECPPLGSQDGLTGIVHSVSEPENVGGEIKFSVDFGSAPFEAFEELLAKIRCSVLSIGTYLEDRLA